MAGQAVPLTEVGGIVRAAWGEFGTATLACSTATIRQPFKALPAAALDWAEADTALPSSVAIPFSAGSQLSSGLALLLMEVFARRDLPRGAGQLEDRQTGPTQASIGHHSGGNATPGPSRRMRRRAETAAQPRATCLTTPRPGRPPGLASAIAGNPQATLAGKSGPAQCLHGAYRSPLRRSSASSRRTLATLC
jgi:hypothetical protein